MDWDIRFNDGCGPLYFGMSREQVGEILGPPYERTSYYDSELRDATGWRECGYLEERLVSLRGVPSLLPSLQLDEMDLLTTPVLTVVELLDRANGGTGQAQGGSLYFEEIGVALLQFENPHIREVVLFAPAYDHGEPLRPLSLEEVAAYYRDQNGHAPDDDMLKLTGGE